VVGLYTNCFTATGEQSGKGVAPHEIVKFLQDITPTKPVPVDARSLMDSAAIAKGMNK
jgi:hypothetical protein